MKKTIMAIVLASALALCATACGNNDTAEGATLGESETATLGDSEPAADEAVEEETEAAADEAEVEEADAETEAAAE